MRWFLATLMLGASLVNAQSDANQKTSRVEGTILSVNGDVVRKATVRLQGTTGQPGQPTSYIDTTDGAGKFLFDAVPPGRYTLSAEKAGFVTARYGTRANTVIGPPLELTAGMEMKDVTIKMTPQGVIAGKVLDQDGDPVVSVQVQAMRSGYVAGRKQLQPTGGTTTNDLGEYRLMNLAPGRYFISANDVRAVRFAQDLDIRSGKGQEVNVTTFYPNGPDVSSAIAVDVAAGAEIRGTDIRLLKAKVYTVRGKALDAPAIAAARATLVLTRKSDSNLPAVLNGGGSSQIRPDGTFEFRSVAPGTYVLQLAQVVNGNQPVDLTGRMDVTIGNSDVDNLVLPLVPYPEITGVVTLEDGDLASLIKPAQNTPGAIGITINLVTTELVTAGVPVAHVEADGTFRLKALPLAKYTLNTMVMPPGTYLKSARYAGQDVTKALIDTTSGTGGTLELVLSSKVATITGSVRNEKGESCSGVMVTLWPKIPDASLSGGVHLASTDPNGAFKFQSLAPGDYYVAAWEELDPGLLQSADFLRQFTSEVKLSEGGQESTQLKLVPAEKIAAAIAKLP